MAGRRTIRLLLAAPAVLCLLAGCGGDEAPLAQVSGRVLFNGRPAPAEVSFEPLRVDKAPGGRVSTGFTNTRGEFELQFTADRRGAVVGRHRVLVRVLRPPDTGAPKSLDDAARPLQVARLEREVRPGTNHFLFALTY